MNNKVSKEANIKVLMQKLNIAPGVQFKIQRNGTFDKRNTYMFTKNKLVVKHRTKGQWWPEFSLVLRELSEGTSYIIKQ